MDTCMVQTEQLYEELFLGGQRLGKNFLLSHQRRLLLASTRLSCCQDVTTHSLRTHSRLVLAEVQIGVAEEIGEVRDTTDVLQGFYNHDVLGEKERVKNWLVQSTNQK